MQQPWLPEAPPPLRSVPDDFSARTPTMPVRQALTVLALAWLLLLMGRSEAILDSAYGLPILPGTEALIAVAEAWNDAMAAFGLPGFLRALRGVLSLGR